MPERRFTRAEAEAALPQVRPLAERMVEHHRAMLELEARQRQLVLRISSNGGDLTPSDVTDVQEELEREGAGLRACVAGIQDLGALVKDLATGLVDFPSERAGEPVLLCWRVGEAEIGFWHREDEGFAGRQPLD